MTVSAFWRTCKLPLLGHTIFVLFLLFLLSYSNHSGMTDLSHIKSTRKIRASDFWNLFSQLFDKKTPKE